MKLRDRILSLLFPKRCPFCNRVIPETERCCEGCREELPLAAGKVCPRCGKSPCICGEESVLSGVFPAFLYEGPATRAILRMKFYGRPAIARHFAPFLAEALPKELSFDAIIPIPMTKAAVRRRGHNQAALLGRFLSEETGIPCRELLIKVRKTRPQHTLNARQRRKNLHGAYDLAAGADVSGQVLLLCDDIITTGSTLWEAAGVLLEKGAKAVYAVTAATTMRDAPDGKI